LFLRDYLFFFQHASSDVERMILGNKCDMNEKRQVSKEKGEKVSFGDLPCLEADCSSDFGCWTLGMF